MHCTAETQLNLLFHDQLVAQCWSLCRQTHRTRPPDVHAHTLYCTDPALHHMALQTGYSHTVARVPSRGRPLLALWPLALDRLRVAACVLYRYSTIQIGRHLRRRLLPLLDALEHTVIEPCTFLDRQASEGLWNYFVRHLETPWICFASSHAQWRAPVSDPFQFAR